MLTFIGAPEAKGAEETGFYGRRKSARNYYGPKIMTLPPLLIFWEQKTSTNGNSEEDHNKL